MKKNKIKAIVTFIMIVTICFSGCQKNAEIPSASIGIIGAMDVEVASIKEAMTVKQVIKDSGVEYYIGVLGKTKVVVAKCDMGKVHAGICASKMIDKYGCTKIINTGVAGSLDSNIKMGDIVVSTDVVQHDFDATPIGFEKGEIPYTGKISFEADEEMIEKVYEYANNFNEHTKAYKGRICSGDQFIASKEKLTKITSEFGGLCCEMEGGAIAQVCYLSDIPFVIMRIISDLPGETKISDYQESEADFSLKCARIVEKMIKEWEE